ncbi:MAG: hypothetical protein E7593_00770 [Ruminococcaceae bacterium]|nr:hypothetical protein [Oscillospiraceae bacterium]
MKFTPKGNRIQAIAVCITLSISALVFFAFSTITDTLASTILNTLGVVLVMLTTLVVTRYLSFTYTYILDDFEFIIINRTINKEYTVCRLYYSDISDICKAKTAKKLEKGVKKHNYSLSVYSNELYYLFVECGNDKEVIVFEPDAFFAKALEKRIKNDIILN